MNHNQIILGFIDLLEKENFDQKSLQNLPQLWQTLDNIDNEQFDAIADAIVDWCANHQPLGETLRVIALRRQPKKADQAKEEQIKDNISLKNKIKQKIEDSQANKNI
ncbi:MAG: hypothetical protein AB4060_15435 [Crocosphaera sp.]